MKTIPSQLPLIAGKNRLEFTDVGESTTVAKLTAGVDRFGERIGKVVTCPVDTRDRFSLFNSSVTGPPSTENIKILQRQSYGIKPRMTGRTGI